MFAVGGWVAGHADEGPMSGIMPGHPPEHHRREHIPMELETITGKVESQTTAPNGQVDGIKLEDGTWVHWPPHLEKYLGKLSEVGQEVSVEGRRQAGPHGEPVLELAALTNVEEKRTFQREFASATSTWWTNGRCLSAARIRQDRIILDMDRQCIALLGAVIQEGHPMPPGCNHHVRHAATI